MKFTITILIFCFWSLISSGQDKTLFFLKKVPQTSYINPAFVPDYTRYVGIPGLSGIMISANSSSFSLNDIIKHKNGLSADTLAIDANRIFDNLKVNNFVRYDACIDILAFGLKYKKGYYSFNFAVKSFGNLAFPKSIKDLKSGNVDLETMTPRNINLTGIDLNGYSYYETAFGASFAMGEKIRIGGRIKILSGINAINTSRFNTKLTTSTDFSTSTLDADIEINASAKGLELHQNKDGYIDKVTMNKSFIRTPYTSNLGLGIDMGLEANPTRELALFASIVDFGFIRWNASAQKVISKGTYVFNGIDITPDASGKINTQTAFEAVTDTLKNKFKTIPGSTKFTTLLFTKMYLGTTYQINSWLKGGFLLKGALYDKVVDPGITLSAIATPNRNFTGVVTLSYYNKTVNNIGLGVVIGDKPVQFYITTDNIIVRFIKNSGFNDPYNNILIPNHSRSMNFQMGVNLFFGEKTFKISRRFKMFEGKRGSK